MIAISNVDIQRLTDDNEALHRKLTHFNRARLSPGFAHEYWRSAVRDEMLIRLQEGNFVEGERLAAAAHLGGVPEDANSFVEWIGALAVTGLGQGDPFFPWLAESATYEQMRWFLNQEVAGEAGFEDLVALSQVKLAEGPKLELAHNYWRAMGSGQAAGMHGPMLSRLADAFGVAPTPETTVWESLALGNLMTALAANRRYAYQSIGALGAIELTAPRRATYVAQALRRLGMDGKARVYFEPHATLDIRHSEAWNREVIGPLVARDPRTARPIAEGAILRLRAEARSFERYRRELAGS